MMTNSDRKVGAIVLAAGQSRRMGQPKMVMPWGEKTVVEQVVQTVLDAGVEEVVVVTGGAREKVEAALANYPVKTVYNSQHEKEEMLSSLKEGIQALSEDTQALLVVLGDQPGIEQGVVNAVVDRYCKMRTEEPAPDPAAPYQAADPLLIVPSYEMRRGHPWLAERGLWDVLLALPEDQTMRDFLHAHEHMITYVEVDSPSTVRDIDTPDEYQSQRPD